MKSLREARESLGYSRAEAAFAFRQETHWRIGLSTIRNYETGEPTTSPLGQRYVKWLRVKEQQAAGTGA